MTDECSIWFGDNVVRQQSPQSATFQHSPTWLETRRCRVPKRSVDHSRQRDGIGKRIATAIPATGAVSIPCRWQPRPVASAAALVDVETMNDDNLSWLSQWYLAQCNSDWEHSYGVKIDTLDNPGWSLKIDLIDTPLQGQAFERVEHGEHSGDLEEWQNSGSWWIARVEGTAFEVSCGPLDLLAAVGVFRRWAEASA